MKCCMSCKDNIWQLAMGVCTKYHGLAWERFWLNVGLNTISMQAVLQAPDQNLL